MYLSTKQIVHNKKLLKYRDHWLYIIVICRSAVDIWLFL